MHDDELRVIDLSISVPQAEMAGMNRPLAEIRQTRKRYSWLLKIIGGLILALLMLVGVIWWLLTPANRIPVNLTVAPGASLSEIIDQMARGGVIRQAQLAKTYIKIIRLNPQIQAGDYQISPNQASLQAVLTGLRPIAANTQTITFYPGATLEHYHSPTNRTMPHWEVLRRAGFKDDQIDQAFRARNHQLFQLFPKLTNLEGLIYPETYQIFNRGTAEQALKRSYDEYWKIIQESNLIEAYRRQGLSLYQGIIIASIVEREVNSASDRSKVAQVFLKRYHQGMMLGSDVTYQYASRLAGKDNDLYIESPFNTRRVIGLPPTPIASPSRSSLLAVAHPTSTDYLYFVSGDDDKTYFAKTLAEHEHNVKRYCHRKCAVH